MPSLNTTSPPIQVGPRATRSAWALDSLAISAHPGSRRLLNLCSPCSGWFRLEPAPGIPFSGQLVCSPSVTRFVYLHERWMCRSMLGGVMYRRGGQKRLLFWKIQTKCPDQREHESRARTLNNYRNPGLLSSPSTNRATFHTSTNLHNTLLCAYGLATGTLINS